ncbi:PhoX family protein [Lentzea sp. HUAS TT2]|uniref:PhoX family protein n=1 Tax=Lentzea sp. HUAS TT2 TaxID=3447454 RepID=UPI003F711FAD
MPPRPTTDQRIIPLPLASTNHAGRSALTCRYRCGDACFHEAPNTSDNPYLGDVIASAVSRRSLLKTTAVLSLAAGGTAAVAAPAAADIEADRRFGGGRGLRFEPVAHNKLDAVVVPPGYTQDVVIRWGDAVLPGAPAFDSTKQTATAQAKQFGFNVDYLALLELDRDRLVLVANHEYTSELVMFAGYSSANPTREQVEIAWAAHGLSVVVLDDHRGKLTPARHRLNRRITATSKLQFTGPAAGSSFLKTSADPSGRTVLGTLNNCGGGVTPWGTVLSGEENFNQYFGNADLVTDPDTKTRLARYGLRGLASERKWERFDKRFDVAQEPNEVNRHGWVVEIDPFDPDFVPRKRTALGRFKHEAAEPRLTPDGRVVLYMGDDERFDYFYKFVSTNRMKHGRSESARRHNLTLLDEGMLYVAKFTGDSPAAEIDGTGKLPSDGAFDGSGEWVALASGNTSFVPGMTAAEVYVFTRLAADKVGATKMDRPEDVEPHPDNGTVYIALTNNSDRGAVGKPLTDEANPRTRNRHGQIMEVVESRNNAAATSFRWRLFLVCGDPADPSTYFAGFPKDQVSAVSCPDNLAFDSHGNLWIATDGSALGSNDGLFGVAVEGRYRGQVRQFLTVPVGAETCGPIIEERRIIVAVQHPGELDGATVEKPGSTWPGGPGTIARPSVVAVRRTDRGRIGD